ncbi:MAG TPA: TonB-dependent receptor [Methylomirabilota bacterium]|nr:TonB-dependent receptor [Methylomirabilota bacterium]
MEKTNTAHTNIARQAPFRIATLLAVVSTGVAAAQTNNPTLLPDVIVEGRDDTLVGIASTASEGAVGQPQLLERPLTKPAEILETIPGVIVTQHSGGGKANQYFLRGFNLDHGTDFATSLNGMPINMPSHGHGQGYSDLNFLIPELTYRVNYRKGVYHADQGDFSSAGAADIEYYDRLPQSIARIEGGSYGYGRALFASSPEAGPGNLLYALETSHYDGPWTNPDDYQKFNGVVGYSQGDQALGFSIKFLGYHGRWNSTDQIAERALDIPGFSRFDNLNPTDAGNSQRYSLIGEWHRVSDTAATKLVAYGSYYDMDLWSDFTYFLTSPQGDQFEQLDERWLGGLNASHTIFSEIASHPVENTFGLQLRTDDIHNGLFQSVQRSRADKLDYDGNPIPATTREDAIVQASLAPYFMNKVQWAEKFRTTAGLRADFYHFDVESDNPLNSGSESDAIVSPKAGLVLGPWADTEFYLNGGLGFHSNDGRGVTARVDPATGAAIDSADPLVRTYGAEFGVRTSGIRDLHSSVALWWLDIDSELLFIGDAGATEASRPSRRYGVEFANYYLLNDWLSMDADLSFSNARFRDSDPSGRHIPGSIETAITTGFTIRNLRNFFGGLHLRYFGPRPLIEDNTVRSSETLLLSSEIGYRFSKVWSLSAEVLNVLDRRDNEIEYYYASRLAGEPVGSADGGYLDRHFHSVSPVSLRVALTARF